ncbi:beta-ketoacyl synthase N-terminal-like domain-containing protein [Bifidobacterium breve]|uniref:beta-ketoacyl synthase N-terminal-like domain-containing protein n=1 Tax=Bifidobacterium breve TaxID=1685 RepID=UPI0035304E12
MTINTACSGSLVVAELACQSLVSNDTSAAILAGANIILKYVEQASIYGKR